MQSLKEESKVSVLIPVYNYEKYVAKCLESVINQTYKNLEIVAVDDGSTDRSGEILDEYAQNDMRLKVIHKENGGIGSALKVAIENATGEYVAFLDSDDFMDLNAYEKLVDIAIKSNADIVMYGVRMIALDGHIRSEDDFEPAEFCSNDEVMEDFVCHNTVTPLSRKFIKRFLLDDLKMMEYSVGIDETISIQVMARCSKLVRIKECYYNAVGEPAKDSVSRRAIDGRNAKTIIKLNQEIIQFCKDNGVKYVNDYIIRYLNILSGQYLTVYMLTNNDDERNIVYEFRIWWSQVKNSRELRRRSKKEILRLLVFSISPKIYATVGGVKFERN